MYILSTMLFYLILPLFTSTVGFADNAHPIHITHYQASIAPNFKTKSIIGKTELTFDKKTESEETLSFPFEGLQIDQIKINGKTPIFKIDGQQLAITIPKNSLQLGVSYHGTPLKGLVFGQDYVYTDFDTCAWMICRTDPGEKATFEITVLAPSEYSMTASGNFIQKYPVGKGMVQNRWKEDTPYSTYLFGFAVGKFHETHQSIGPIQLNYFGVSDSSSDLLKKFKDTARAIQFFEEKSGVKFPHSSYTQVLVPDDEAQEKDAFAIIGKSALDPILTNPQEDWVIVHELSHQWWGNSLTCKTWSDFWLNEGITTFMVAAYKEMRWGKQAYDHEMELAQKRYQKAIDQKFDVPLTYSGKYPSLGMRRVIAYSKGALFMAALRKLMGDQAFWKGLREYTRANVGKSVVSKAFQNQMEKSDGKSLDVIFNRWVY